MFRKLLRYFFNRQKEDIADEPIVITKDEILSPPSSPFLYPYIFSVQPGIIEISKNNLEHFEPDIIMVTANDIILAERIAEHQVLRVEHRDIPPIPETIRLRAADIPTDLNNITVDCYHGTSWEAAEKIRREGFCVGPGMAMGAGVYFTVGAVGISKSYAKTSRPCIIHARVAWGQVAYLDDSRIPAKLKNSTGEARTQTALRAGYHSLISTRKYSKQNPAIGVVLGSKGTYIRQPRIEIIELIDPNQSH